MPDCRRRVPTNLVKIVGKKFIQISLRTLKKSDAIAARSKADVEWDAKFEQAREALVKSTQVEQLIDFEGANRRIKSYVQEQILKQAQMHIATAGEISDEQKRENLADKENLLDDLSHRTESGIATNNTSSQYRRIHTTTNSSLLHRWKRRKRLADYKSPKSILTQERATDLSADVAPGIVAQPV